MHLKKNTLPIISGFVLLILISVAYILHSEKKFIFYPKEQITVQNTKLTVWIANTEKRQVKGLSKSPPLPHKTGLLFPFHYSDTWGIWMKDMQYPIDIFWLDQDFVIVHEERNVSPNTYPKVFTPPEPAFFVLETMPAMIPKKNPTTQ